MRLSPFALAALIILFVSTTTGIASTQAQPVSRSVFYFHYKSETYRNENASIIVLEEANFTAPISSTPIISEVAAAIRNATTIFGTIWIGSIAWLTQPLTEATKLVGAATFTVWLSSDDATPSYSGVGAGVAVLNQQNQTVGKYVYTYSYAQGKILTSTPTEYSFNVELNQEISAGQRLIFAVGVGSTSEGWHMKIFFDDSQHASRVLLPSSITVVPEFQPNAAILTFFGATILLLSLTKRKPPAQSKSHQEAPAHVASTVPVTEHHQTHSILSQQLCLSKVF
jgi:hypothetical protein